jgi:hypothetical protein
MLLLFQSVTLPIYQTQGVALGYLIKGLSGYILTRKFSGH